MHLLPSPPPSQKRKRLERFGGPVHAPGTADAEVDDVKRRRQERFGTPTAPAAAAAAAATTTAVTATATAPDAPASPAVDEATKRRLARFGTGPVAVVDDVRGGGPRRYPPTRLMGTREGRRGGDGAQAVKAARLARFAAPAVAATTTE
jgi:hypothetical protein